MPSSFRYLLVLGGLLFALVCRAQVYPNLGLEPGRNHGQPLVLWSKGIPLGGQLTLDSTVHRQGRGSVRLALTASDTGPRRAYFGCNLVPDSARGQLVTVCVWVRKQAWQGRLSVSANTTASTVAGLSQESATVVDSLPGSMDWQQLVLRLPVKATAFRLGLLLWAEGSGRVWVDDITLSAKGRPLPELAAPATEALLLSLEESLVPNWDAERLPPVLTRPDPAIAILSLDSLSPRHGRYALRVQRISPASQPAPTVYVGTLPLNLRDTGKTLRVSGYWRRPGTTGPGLAPQFAVRLLKSGPTANGSWWADTLGRKTAGADPPAQWCAFAFEVPLQLLVSHDEEAVSLGALSLGVWLPDARPLMLDNLTFTLDGKPYAPTGPPLPPPPNLLEVAWLRAALKPLRLTAPASAAADLAALGNYLAPARLVGLGELSHGSHEVFVLHDQLIRYLVGQKGYTGLLLDASPTSCAALQNYLHTGRGEPAQLLTTLGDGWNVPEMLALVGWLRHWQQAHASTPFLLAGIAINQPEQVLASLRQLLESDDAFVQTRLRRASQLLAAFPHPAATAPDLRRQPEQSSDSLIAPLRRVLSELRTGLDARAQVGGHPISLAVLARRHYYLRLIEQGAVWRRIPAPDTAFTYRQACLAENAYYLSQHEAGSAARLVLWADNRSVAHSLTVSERPLGEWLHATWGTGYQALGVVLGQGSFAAPNAAGTWAPSSLAAYRPGAYEVWLTTGPATSWLPLKGLELLDDNAWLFQQQLLREIDQAAPHNQYQLHSLRQEFDAVVFLRESTASRPLP